MNICIFASIWCQNLGDELIVKNEIALLREKYGTTTKFRVFSYDCENIFFSDAGITYKEYFPIDIKNPRNIFRNFKGYIRFLSTLLWSDVVVIGWGGLFYEQEIQSNRSPLDIWVYRMYWIYLLRKKTLFFAVGIDVNSDLWKQKIRKIFGGKDAEITVRDTESFLLLKEQRIDAEIVDDPVMQEQSSWKRGRVLSWFQADNIVLQELEKYSFLWKKVGVALRKGYIGKTKNEKLEILMIEEMLKVIENKGGTIILLPHSFHPTDRVANDILFLQQFLKPWREIKLSMEDVYSTYTWKQIDVCVAMRLHSMILSYSYGIDMIAISYSQKTRQLLKKLLM